MLNRLLCQSHLLCSAFQIVLYFIYGLLYKHQKNMLLYAFIPVRICVGSAFERIKCSE